MKAPESAQENSEKEVAGARCPLWRLAVRYVLAILLPPIAVLSCGKWFQAVVNLVLTLCFWLPGAIHALFVVNDHHNEQNADRIVNAMRRA